MDGGLEHRKSSVERTGAEIVHDKEQAARRILDGVEKDYLDLADELNSDEGKKLAGRIEDLGTLVTQMQLLLDDEVDALNVISTRHEALKKQMGKHLN